MFINHFFLILRQQNSDLPLEKYFYPFTLCISLKQIIALAFHSELPMGTVCFIEKKETNQSECVQRQNKRIKSRADSRTSQSHPHRHCMGTTATSINGHSGTRCWARFPQRNISKGGLGSLPSAFRSLQLLCAIRTKLRLSNYVVKCFDLNASLLVLIITSLKGESFTLPRARTRLTSLPKPLHR